MALSLFKKEFVSVISVLQDVHSKCISMTAQHSLGDCHLQAEEWGNGKALDCLILRANKCDFANTNTQIWEDDHEML